MIEFKDVEALQKAGFKDYSFDGYNLVRFTVPNVKLNIAGRILEYGDVPIKMYIFEDNDDEDEWEGDEYEDEYADEDEEPF